VGEPEQQDREQKAQRLDVGVQGDGREVGVLMGEVAQREPDGAGERAGREQGRPVVRGIGGHEAGLPDDDGAAGRGQARRDAYPAEFRMTQADIDNAPEVPSIPPLLPGY
jgi:hypothetical protein